MRSFRESEEKYWMYDFVMFALSQGLNPAALISQAQTTVCASRKVTATARSTALYVNAVFTLKTSNDAGQWRAAPDSQMQTDA